MAAHTYLSIIIPALNAARTLSSVMAPLGGKAEEIIVIDGGSTDETVDIAKAAGAEVTICDRGRGTQLQLGGEKAAGVWLLFLHADTRLSDNWRNAAENFISHPGNRHRAAVFRFALNDPSSNARRIESFVNWRSRNLGLPYGDQALLISREYYDSLGGFRPIPLMEDVDIVRRIGRDRLTVLNATAMTSSVRYREDGWWLRPIRNILCLSLYFVGVPPRILAKIYQ